MADANDRRVTRDRYINAIMTTIADESTVDGITAIPAREAGQACMLVLAALITGSEATRTPKALREACEMFARDLRTQVKHMQATYEQTGRRPFQAELVTPS
jgi:hypothetical protein